MTREQKYELVDALSEDFRRNPSFYVLNVGGLSVERANAFRRTLQSQGLGVRMVKNTLIRKALEKQAEGRDYTQLFEGLKESSAIVFVGEQANLPAKVLKEFRKDAPLPAFKAAYIEESVYLGEDQLESLEKIKSKKDLLGELVGLLQSPARNVVSALQSSGGKLAGIVKTLSERPE